MEKPRTYSPMKQEETQEYENKPNLMNVRNTDSVKKRLPMDHEQLHSGEKMLSTPSKFFQLQKQIGLGVLNSIGKSPAKPHSKNKLCFDSLPREIHYLILSFLNPLEIIKRIRPISKYYNQLTHDKIMWRCLHRNRPLKVSEKYKKQSCIVERRSKGKLFKACSWLDDSQVIRPPR